MKVKSYLKLIRINQVFKNFFIFIPLVFSKKFLDLSNIASVLILFLLFYLISAIIYIINDLHDIEEDQRHPIKQDRPLPSGEITRKEAIVLMSILAGIEVLGLIALSVKDTTLLFPFGFYLLNNILYTFFLKRVPFIELLSVSLGYLLRIWGGAIIIDEKVSFYLLLAVLTLTLFIITSKRFRELKLNGTKSRKVLRYYSMPVLTILMSFSLTTFLSIYFVFTLSTSKTNHPFELFYSSFLVLIISVLFLYDVLKSKKNIDDPFKLFLGNWLNIFLIILWGAYVTAVLYFF